MKKLICIVAAVLVAGFTNIASAQKFGHIDSQQIIGNLPDTKAAQTTMEAEQKKVESQLETMGTEYQDKLRLYQENVQLADAAPEKWSVAIRSDKEQELMSLQDRIQKFRENAQTTLQQKQSDLLSPIMKKIDDAVKKIADNGGYVYVFDKNAVLYINEALSTDLTPAVKKELGIQ